ncbi:phage tail terminator protein [Shigella flexneri]
MLARLREQCGRQRHVFSMGFRILSMRGLAAVAVWLSDAQYTGKMTDEDDWCCLHIAVFIRVQHRIRAGYVDGEHHFPRPQRCNRHFPDSSTP